MLSLVRPSYSIIYVIFFSTLYTKKDTFEIHRLGERHARFDHIYSQRLKELALEIAGKRGIACFKGSYASTCGPTYETPYEVKMGVALGNFLSPSRFMKLIAKSRGLRIWHEYCA